MLPLWPQREGPALSSVGGIVSSPHNIKDVPVGKDYVVQQYGTSGVVCGGDNVSGRPKHPRLIAGGARTEGVGGDERSECLEDFISAT